MDAGWYKSEHQEMKKSLDCVYDLFQVTKCKALETVFLKKRKQYKKSLKSAKILWHDSLISSANPSKTLWSIVRPESKKDQRRPPHRY